jgi:hypothetical protein
MQKDLLAATALVALLALFVAVAQAAPAAVAEPMDIDPEILSKMALQRAKARNLGQTGSAKSGTGNTNGAGSPAPFDCGAVNIGNIIGNGRPGFQPREVTVVITGDVINANNQCK